MDNALSRPGGQWILDLERPVNFPTSYVRGTVKAF